MKKIISIILAASILLTACGKDDSRDEQKDNSTSKTNTSQNVPKDGKYINGTYTAKWETYVNDWQEFVILEIKDDIINILQYDAVDKEGNFRSTDEKENEEYAENNKKSNLPVMTHKEKFKAIIDNFYEGDKNTKKMECVAGATRSTERFKLLVRSIINGNARTTGNVDIVYVPTYGDGTYRVEEAKFSSGWKDFVVIKVENGIPQMIQYDSIDKDGNFKSEDEEYKNKMIDYTKSRKSGELYPQKYQEILIKEFNEIKDNNYDDIETVAGATSSSDIFKILVKKAMYNSSIRGKEEDAIYKYIDGEYHAEMSEYVDGWKDYVDIKIENDKIYILDFNSVNATGQKKTESEEIKKTMMNGNAIKNLPETYPEKYRTDIISAFSQSEFDVIEMENISGATLSSNNFKLMVGEILRRCAVDGKVNNISVEPYNIG